MSKRLLSFLIVICLVLSLSGCHFSIRGTVEGKGETLPPLRIDSTLICSVASIDGNRLTVSVLEGNNNYDKDDDLFITYETVEKDQQIRRGDVITVTYNYVTDVSAIAEMPHITVKSVTVLQDYVPPETTVETTTETTE